jgi:hypothetical protein
MNPFRYPDDRHARRQAPGLLSNYRLYKPFLREEFERQCVYCRMPDGVQAPDAFGVDHYRPASRFPDLRCAYENLFYCCNVCNRLKGTFWPSEAEWAAGRFVPNPCDHVMRQHLRYSGAYILPESSAGQLAIDLLLLNDELVIGYRELILRSIERCLAQQKSILDSLLALEARVPQAEGALATELRLDIAILRSDLAAIHADLERLTSRTL